MRKSIIALLTALMLLLSVSFAVTANTEDLPIMPLWQIHWSQTYLDYLEEKYDIGAFFSERNLDTFISVDDFASLVKLTIDENYDRVPDSATREAIVYECARIWAYKTGQDLDQLVIIQIAPYTDADQLDSKYAHGVYVAYLQEIARGKGNGIFDPKTPVTYGELATLIARTIWAIEKESPSGDKTSVSEAGFETSASYEIKDGKVVFDFELVNLHKEPQTLTFSSGQQFEVTVTDEAGNEVYRFSDGKFFTMALVNRTIDAGESLKWRDEWNMTNKAGEKVGPGNYTAVIRILAMPESLPDSDSSITLDESQFTAVIRFTL